MRTILILAFSLLSFRAFSQADSALKPTQDSEKSIADTLLPYEASPYIPTFSLQMADSSWFFNTGLNEKKPVLILYFSPDCGHCQLETETLLTKINRLPDLQIVMITSRPLEDMVKFATKYKINKFPTIKIGTDHSHRITSFYKIEFTPFSALYDKKGKLVKVYRKGIDMDELIKLTGDK